MNRWVLLIALLLFASLVFLFCLYMMFRPGPNPTPSPTPPVPEETTSTPVIQYNSETTNIPGPIKVLPDTGGPK
jgi:hypothetical protein